MVVKLGGSIQRPQRHLPSFISKLFFRWEGTQRIFARTHVPMQEKGMNMGRLLENRKRFLLCLFCFKRCVVIQCFKGNKHFCTIKWSWLNREQNILATVNQTCNSQICYGAIDIFFLISWKKLYFISVLNRTFLRLVCYFLQEKLTASAVPV